MSKRMSSTPIILASCRQTSVLPTPVGPANRNDPIGLSPSFRPALESLIALDSVSIASSCPKITIFRFSSSCFSDALSDAETLFGGMRAIFATIISISPTPICFFRFEGGCNCWYAPTSSITSIALSGIKRSVMYFPASSAATRNERSVYLS